MLCAVRVRAVVLHAHTAGVPCKNSPISSRLSGFYRRRGTSAPDRRGLGRLTPPSRPRLRPRRLTAEQADHMIENVIGVYALPLGIATISSINGRDVLVPMVVESRASSRGELRRETRARGRRLHDLRDDPVMIGQIQVLDVADLDAAAARVLDAQDELLPRPTAATA